MMNEMNEKIAMTDEQNKRDNTHERGHVLDKETYTTLRKSFDMEYSTMWRREMQYLEEHGLHYTFVRHSNDTNIPIYKYKKTPELFSVLAVFFAMIEKEKKERNEVLGKADYDA